LLEIKLIDYKGCLKTANEFVNSDLFWACRGAGGGNFGVIVSMTFNLPTKVGKVTLFELNYSNPSKLTQIKFFDTWQKWIQTANERVNMKGGLYNITVNLMAFIFAVMDYSTDFLQNYRVC